MRKVEYVSIVQLDVNTWVNIIFTDGSVESFVADETLNGLNGEESIYMRKESKAEFDKNNDYSKGM